MHFGMVGGEVGVDSVTALLEGLSHGSYKGLYVTGEASESGFLGNDVGAGGGLALHFRSGLRYIHRGN
jgi:hypothetical protein